MSMDDEKYWMLGRGEEYIEPLSKPHGRIDKYYRFAYEEIRARLKNDLKLVRETADALPDKYRLDELVLCLRMLPEFTAKSYYPQTVTAIPGVRDVGSRRWTTTMPANGNGAEEAVASKLIFIRTGETGLENLERRLDQAESALPRTWKEQIQRFDSISFLRSDEALLGFSDDWVRGRVELVLHPFAQLATDSMRKLFAILEECGVAREKINPKPYDQGPTFVSVEMDRAALGEIAQFNPLRTAHPLQFDTFPVLRSAGRVDGPSAPSQSIRSIVKIGMFDGGVDSSNDLLKGFVEEGDEVASRRSLSAEEHGTAVAGALLYGELSQYSGKDALPPPSVTVESFRALPPSDPKDYDLYESVDLIESVVPQHDDITVYNLSFGPKGSIDDDHITRFTYVLDQLAKKHDVLFTVAVGNDGDLPSPFDRVQAPSDMVNGLGVGAYTVNRQSGIRRAEYSSVGAGREGCKVKPDIVAFGGCSCQPFHVIAEFGQKDLTWGTSLATPLVARSAAELIGRCGDMTPLSARCVMIHTASNPVNVRDTEMGYGIVSSSFDDILRSSNQTSTTVLYQSSLLPGKYAKLPVPIPRATGYNARVTITWTIALLSSISILNSDEYTHHAVEDTFYPSDSVYGFTKTVAGKEKTVAVDVSKDSDRAEELLREGWVQSKLPKTASAKRPTEKDLRGQHLKWDTVVKNTVTKQLSSLQNPFLTLHAMNRNSGVDELLKYAVAVTVSVPKYRGNLYEDIRAQYSKLQPIRVRAVNEIMVSV